MAAARVGAAILGRAVARVRIYAHEARRPQDLLSRRSSRACNLEHISAKDGGQTISVQTTSVSNSCQTRAALQQRPYSIRARFRALVRRGCMSKRSRGHVATRVHVWSQGRGAAPIAKRVLLKKAGELGTASSKSHGSRSAQLASVYHKR